MAGHEEEDQQYHPNFFQAEDGIRDRSPSRGLGDVYKRQLTGHTNTDNAATFLLNLARGSNYAGLSYIDKKRLLDHHIYLIRPLLIFSREDTKKFCHLQNIPIWEDPTNHDLTIKRNLVRGKIIPI